MKEYRIAIVPGDGISATTADGKVLTRDLGGHATTHEIRQEISRKIQEYNC